MRIFRKYSEDKFVLNSRLAPADIIARLREKTLEKKMVAMFYTEKDFIGRINENSFVIIESSSFIPYGAACVLKGVVDETSAIDLVTTLHKVFRILFIVWFIVITVMFLMAWILSGASLPALLAFVIVTAMGALLLRLFMHGMYVLARNRAVAKMKMILEVGN